MKQEIGKQRDYSIDLLKCLAAVLITYSHLEPLFGKYAALTTGGSFGDCLFYTLLLSSRKADFFNWYKRRILRIYPTVFAWALTCSIFFHSDANMLKIIIKGGGFFVSCIMIFYLLFFPMKQYAGKHIGWCMLLVFALCYAAFFFVDKENVDMMYCWTWSMYFLPMLLGAMLGKINQEKTGMRFHWKTWMLLSGLLLSATGYYGIMYIAKIGTSLQVLRPLVIIPQLGVTFFFYMLCRTTYAKRLYNNKRACSVVMFVGGLCLEIYLVQPPIIKTFAMPHLFPLNVAVVVTIILLGAYCLKCISRMWEQTFKEADYDWKEVIKPY